MANRISSIISAQKPGFDPQTAQDVQKVGTAIQDAARHILSATTGADVQAIIDSLVAVVATTTTNAAKQSEPTPLKM